MTAPVSRRTALAGMAGATVAATAVTSLPTTALANPDAELFRLIRETKRFHDAWEDALDREEAISPIGGEKYEVAYSRAEAVRPIR